MKYVSIFFVFFLFACGKYQDNFLDNTKTVSLTVSDTLSIDCERLGKPYFILPYGDFVILADNSSKHLLSSYNLENKSIVSILEKGKAKNEALIVTGIHELEENKFYVYDDFSKKRIVM